MLLEKSLIIYRKLIISYRKNVFFLLELIESEIGKKDYLASSNNIKNNQTD